MKSNVLLIVRGFQLGGIETYIDRFLNYNCRKIDITILSKSGIGGYYESNYKNKGANTNLFYIGEYNVLSWTKFYFHLAKKKYDVVCDFTGTFAAMPLFISKIAGVPKRISFYRGSKYQFKPTILKKLFTKFLHYVLLFSSTKILSNSISALEFFHPNRDKKSAKFKVIYNGIPKGKKTKSNELRKKLGIPENAFLIGHVGRFAPAKNHETICEVAKIILEKDPKVLFIFCGINVEENIKPFLDENGIKDNFIMPGLCENIYDYYEIMDSFLFPSISEGQPNALLEAIMSKTPIVASNIPSILESLPSPLRSQLFSPKDSATMAKSILEIKNGKLLYDLEEFSKWVKINYAPEKRFKEFMDELI